MDIRHSIKRIAAYLCVLALLTALPFPVFAAFRRTTLYIGGQKLVATPEVCRMGGVTYVPLRPFVHALDENAEIGWNDRKKTATVTGHWLEIRVPQDESYIVANGRYLYLDGKVVNNGGSLMVPLEPLAKAFGVEAAWDEETETAYVTGEIAPILPGWAFYEEETLYWLSRIVHCEAGIESLEGMIAVGQVVLNRVEKGDWPDTVYEVIFDRRFGVQFTPTVTGTIYEEPSADAVIAAKLALEGADVVGESCYFMNPDIADSQWFEENCEYVDTVGRHRFYKDNS